MGHSKGSPEGEIHSDTGLPKKMETFQINNPGQHLQELEERQQKQPRASRRKEITKIRAELNNIETVSYTHLTLPTIILPCRSRWSPYH